MKRAFYLCTVQYNSKKPVCENRNAWDGHTNRTNPTQKPEKMVLTSKCCDTAQNIHLTWNHSNKKKSKHYGMKLLEWNCQFSPIPCRGNTNMKISCGVPGKGVIQVGKIYEGRKKVMYDISNLEYADYIWIYIAFWQFIQLH